MFYGNILMLNIPVVVIWSCRFKFMQGAKRPRKLSDDSQEKLKSCIGASSASDPSSAVNLEQSGRREMSK